MFVQVMSTGNWMHILYQSKLDAKKVHERMWRRRLMMRIFV